ncbi:hypothetical protein PVK06_019507 [Gossypium arboreum]|uniref:Uncharacterized protein n=1 Tax=Gossypium arboreum TaxID=29729 RepID=A0ABR0PKD7_GOSAR|nr:hypothetical protein PVK06_019507 [Gossypium arboreum]
MFTLHSAMYFTAPSSPTYYTLMSTLMPTQMPTSIQTYSSIIMIPKYYTQSGFTTSYGYSSIMSQTPITLLFYQGGSSPQPPSRRMEDT